MNAFQNCSNTSDVVPLYLPQQLFLKPIAKINISLQLPNVKKVGKSISHWEIMEKIRELVRPDEFTVLKVTKTTIEFVRFEAEFEVKSKLERVVDKLHNKMIRLKNFSEHMRLRAAVSKSNFPTRQVWDDFFHQTKDMNESKPGERPDSVHISNLPSKWFVPYHLLNDEDQLPSEKMFYKIFEKFGSLRYVDIPICDPYRNKMKDHISGIKDSDWEKKDFFEGYIQFRDYMGFTKCMDALRDMKLMRKEEEGNLMVDIKVDFDKCKHLSDSHIRRREIVRDRLVKKQREKENKEKNEFEEKKRQEEVERKNEKDQKLEKIKRRELREEKRKAKILEELKIKSSDEINAKIAREEKKLMKVQRKLESIRLIEELFRRVKQKREKEKVDVYNVRQSKSDKELKRFKNLSELDVLNQKEKLHNVLKGRVMLKTVLKDTKLHHYSSSSEELDEPSKRNRNTDIPSERRPDLVPDDIFDPMWGGYNYQPTYHHYQGPMGPMYQLPDRPHPAFHMMYPDRGRGGFSRGMLPGPSRGAYTPRRFRGYNNSRFRGGGYRGIGNRNSYTSYQPELEEEYMKYFSKFLNDRDRDVGRRVNSRSRSRSRSYHRSSRRSRSRSRRSYSADKRRSYSRSRSRGRRSRTRSRSKSPSRHRRSRSRRQSNSKRGQRDDKSRSKTPDKRKSDHRRSRSASQKSVDSSKFISHGTMRADRLENELRRSRSWSLPAECAKDAEKKRSSWSRTPETKQKEA